MTRAWGHRTVLAMIIALTVFTGNALAAARFPAVTDLANPVNARSVRFDGSSVEGRLGNALASGDIDGDGIDDLVVGAYRADGGRGETYVLFGRGDVFTGDGIIPGVSPDSLNIEGANLLDWSGRSVAVADVNGDTFDDIIIGAERVDPGSPARINAGAVYIVYGSAALKTAGRRTLAGSPAGITVIHGDKAEDRAGTSVAAGDVNGDGFADVIIGAPTADINAKVDAGTVYIVYGSAVLPSTQLIDLHGTPAGVTRICGEVVSGRAGTSVSAGDLDADGYAETVLGGPGRSGNGGGVYIVSGRVDLHTTSEIDLEVPAADEIYIFAEAGGDSLGASIFVGKMNSDSYYDVVMGAPGFDATGRVDAGKAYVLFGSATVMDRGIDYLHLGVPADYVTVTGEVAGDRLGSTVSAGDINHDGHPELFVGAPAASPAGRTAAGKAFVVWGRMNFSSAGSFDLSLSPVDVSSVYGAVAGDGFGSSLAAVDLDGDGTMDIVIGAPDADPGNKSSSGSGYAITGHYETNLITHTPESDVYVNSTSLITMYFDSDMSEVTVIAIDSGTGVIAGTITIDGSIARFNGSAQFTPNGTVSVRVNGKNNIGEDISEINWQFFVKENDLPPTILSRSPDVNEVNVSPADSVIVAFSGDVMPDSTTVTVIGGTQGVITMTESWIDSTLFLVNALPFGLGEIVTVTISAADLHGDRAEYNWQFSVRPECDPPRFIANVNGGHDLMYRTSPIELVFPTDVLKDSVSTVMEGNLSAQINGAWTWSDTIYTFTPSTLYLSGETINLTVNAEDIHRNALVDSVVTFHVKPDEIPPSIVSRSPLAGEDDVTTGASVTVEFSIDVDRDSTEVVLVSAHHGTLAATSSWVDYTVTVTPTAVFSLADTITVFVDACDSYANHALTNWSFNTKADNVPPTYQLVVPQHPAMMGWNDPIYLVFSADVDTGSVTKSLKKNLLEDVPGSWAWSDSTLTFTPSQPYTPATQFVLTVDAADNHGNMMVQRVDYFTVKPEQTPPSIITRSPVENEVNVDRAKSMVLAFNNDVVRDSTSVSLVGTKSGAIPYTKSWVNSTVTITPTTNLQASETVSITVNTGDIYANRAVYRWYFTTGTELDVSYYTIVAPADPTLMSRTAVISLSCDANVNTSTVQTTVTGNVSGTVAGSWQWSGNSYLFTPADGYSPGEMLTLTVDGSDIYSTVMPRKTFTFAVKGDEIPPTILRRLPHTGDTNIHPSTPITIKFSADAVDDSTSVTLTGVKTGVYTPIRAWSDGTITLTPSTTWALGDTITVSANIGDIFANRTQKSYKFSIREEITPPVVTVSAPHDSLRLEPLDTITLTFPADIDTSSVTYTLVSDDGTPIAGSWQRNGTICTFTPVGYEPGTFMTLTIDAEDINGNIMDRRVQIFRIKLDEIPPVIVSRSPLPGSMDVGATAPVVIGFSADVYPDSTTVTLTGSKQGGVATVTTWNNAVATLTHAAGFTLNQTVTVSVRAIDLDGNVLTDSWSFGVKSDINPPVYTVITEPPSGELTQRSPVTFSFPADIDSSSVNLSVTGSSSGSVSGALTWIGTSVAFKPSGLYQAGETLTFRIDASDIYGNVMPTGVETFVVGQHYPWLDITAVTLVDSATFKYRIDFTFGDPDGNYVRTRNWQYSIANGAWKTIQETQIAGNESFAPGSHSLTWSSGNLFVGLYTDNVRFRMDAHDGLFGSGMAVSPAFNVDRNVIPTVSMTGLNVNYTTGIVSIGYRINDAEKDRVSLTFDYSVNNGDTWLRGTPGTPLDNLAYTQYTGTFAWQYDEGLTNGIDYFGFRVRLVPRDYKQGVTFVSNDYNIDLNAPPAVTVDDLFVPQSGDVPIRYHIADAENDTIRFVCYYSTDGGTRWKETGNVSGATDILDSTGEVIWHSKRDVASMATFYARFRLIAWDHDVGTGDETGVFQLMNNAPPAMIAALPDTVGKRLVLPYTVTDTEKDPVSLHLSWSTNGTDWYTGTLGGTYQDVAVKTAADTLIWDCGDDVGTGFFPTALVRLTPTDAQNPYSSSVLNHLDYTVVLDNEAPRFETVRGFAGSDTVYVTFHETVIDSLVTVAGNYTLSGDRTVTSVTVSGRRYTLTLGEGSELGYDPVTITAGRLTDHFDNSAENVTAEFAPDDDNANPLVAVAALPDTISGNVTVRFTVTDNENDTVDLAVYYSTDHSATWLPAASTGMLTSLTPDKYTGLFFWNSAVDLTNRNIADVMLRIVPSDSQKGNPTDVGPLYVMNNFPPEIALSALSPGALLSGDVEFEFTLSDSGSDTLTVRPYYSIDGGTTYHTAAVTGKLGGLTPEEYQGSFLWRSDQDLPGIFGDVLFKVVPEDRRIGYADSLFVRLDNYGVSDVAIELPGTEQSGDVTVSYAVNDPHAGTVHLLFDYSVNGSVWLPASIGDGDIAVGPGGYEDSLVWNTAVDLDGYDGIVRMRSTPNNGIDGIVGYGDTYIDNNDLPVIAVEAPAGEVSGNVTFPFTVTDTEEDTVDIAIVYSIDDGARWYEAEATGDMNDLVADGRTYRVVWKTESDLPGKEYTAIRVRLTVSDVDAGNTVELTGIHLDNNHVPRVTLSLAVPDSIYETAADISYQLTDDEKNMLSMAITYSLDDGGTWLPATVTGQTQGIFSSAYSGTFTWEIGEDIAENYGTALLLAVPSDTEEGAPDTLAVAFNTFGVARVTVTAPSGELNEDVPVSFVVADKNGRTVDLGVEYSTDGGAVWQTAAVEGAVTGLEPSSYEGSFVWMALNDIDGYEGNVLLRVTPDNGAPGLAAVTILNIDYNRPPNITAVTSPTDTEYTGTMAIRFNPEDENADTLTVAMWYSTDGGETWSAATLDDADGIMPGEAATVLWDSFADIGHVYRRAVHIRLEPRDHDSGESIDAGPFTVTNLVGDFTRDLRIDGDDLGVLADGLSTGDTAMDIAPVEGSPPDLTPVSDGLVDFEDFAAFVWMWNWYSLAVESGSMPAAKPLWIAGIEGEPYPGLQLRVSGRGEFAIESDASTVWADFVVTASGGAKMEVQPGGLCGSDGTVFLTRAITGDACEIATARLDKAHDTAGGALATVHLGESADDVTVYYRVRFDGGKSYTGTMTVESDDLYRIPAAYYLGQNAPNPFNPSTSITYGLPHDGHVSITVRNLQGQLVETLQNRFMTAGTHTVVWMPRGIGSGVYFCTIESGGFIQTRKMLFLK